MSCRSEHLGSKKVLLLNNRWILIEIITLKKVFCKLFPKSWIEFLFKKKKES
jgi:hypothetical protein